MKVKRNKKFTATDIKDINIDIAVETTTAETIKNNSVRDFILSIYDSEILKLLFGFLMVALLSVLAIFSAYGLQPKSGELTIISQLTNDDGNFSFKGWEMTQDLKDAVEAGDISLKNITVIEKGSEVKFDGGDSDKITIVSYKTVIEQNDNPKLYSDEYWNELCKQGKNAYVLRTIGLSTEATEKEGAE